MIEVTATWDLFPGSDRQAYQAFAKKTIGAYLKAPGFVEFRAFRNALDSPQVRIALVWKTMTDWASFFESDEWEEINAEWRTFATNISVKVWGPSLLVPEPLRPGG